MEALVAIFATGLVAGTAHVYTGADHLAALMPLAVGQRRGAAWVGIRWGAGHSIGVVLVAVLLMIARQAIDLGPLEAWSERCVGVVLIGLGALGLRAALRRNLHLHEHSHGGDVHVHLHVHGTTGHHVAGEHGDHEHAPHLHPHAAIVAGTVHGVAGMAHLLGVLPSLALPTLTGSFTYLGGFAAGSMLAMSAFTAALGWGSTALGARAPHMMKGTMCAAATVCILVGIVWLVVPSVASLS